MARAQLVEFLMAGLRNTDGSMLSGGKVFTYQPGTTTLKTTYSTFNKSASHTNPIILDSFGAKQVWADGTYDFLVKDSNDNILYTLEDLFYGVADGISFYGGDSSGSANVYEITVSPAPGSYEEGQIFSFVASQSNTGASTLNVNGLGALSITGIFGSLSAYEIISGFTYFARYDFSSNCFKLLSSPTNGIWQTWTPTVTGFSVNPSNTSYKYCQIGKLVIAVARQAVVGTSNATGFTITAPVAAATVTNATWTAPLISATDNGASISTGIATIASASGTINLYTTHAGAAWTAANGKAANFTLIYEAA